MKEQEVEPLQLFEKETIMGHGRMGIKVLVEVPTSRNACVIETLDIIENSSKF